MLKSGFEKIVAVSLAVTFLLTAANMVHAACNNCPEGYYCNHVGVNECEEKLGDGIMCSEEGLYLDQDDCIYGCISGKYYKENREVLKPIWRCGVPPSGISTDTSFYPLPSGPAGAQMTDKKVPGRTTDNSGIIQCGRPGQHMCTLCDIIRGMNIIIQYIMKIAIGIALLAIAIGGILYVVSAGDSGMMDMAKKAITNALIGFVIIFGSYLIVNTTIVYLGTRSDLGIRAEWGTFDCNTTADQH